jgi:hypothetical protein
VTRARIDSSRAKAAEANDNKNMSAQNSFMIFQRCSDVVELRVEHAILDTESCRNAEFSSVSEQPRRANFRGTPRTSDDHSVQRAGFSIDQLGELSIASSAAANACHDFVRMELVANPDFHADLCGAVIDQIRLPSCLISIAPNLRSIG